MVNVGLWRGSATVLRDTRLFAEFAFEFELVGRPSADGHGAQLWAVTPEGTIAMSAEIGLD